MWRKTCETIRSKKTQNDKRYPTVLKEFDMAKCGQTTTKTETIEKQVVSGKVITSKKRTAYNNHKWREITLWL